MKQLVKLTVENPLSADEMIAPVSTGLPIPAHVALKDIGRLVLCDEAGRSVPAQFVPLGWQADQSTIKWLLVQCVADVPAGGKRTYTLKLADRPKEPADQTRLVASKSSSGIVLDTGKIRVWIDKQKPLLSNAMALEGDGLWIEIAAHAAVSIRTCDETYIADAPAELLLEDNGELNAVIRASGNYVSKDGNRLSGFAYVVRIEAWRGRSELKISHTIINEGKDASLQHLGIEWNVPAPAVYTIGHTGGFAEPYGSLEKNTVGVLSESFHENVYGDLSSPGNVQPSGRHFWWMSASSQDCLFTVSVREFNERYPKSIEGLDGRLRVGLLPGRSKVKDSFPPGGQTLDCYFFKEGEARTHEVQLGVYGAGTDVDTLNRSVLSFQAPLLALAPWEWYTGSGALGDLAPRSETYPVYEQAADESLAIYLERRASKELYGDRNFGDDEYGRAGTWNNGEYDYTHVGMLHFLRGAGREWYEEMTRPYARHFMDIDVCHAGKDAGKIYAHCERHNSEGAKLGSHAWLRGVMEYYCFSGDRRAKEVAVMVADVWSASILRGEGFEGTERGVTWPVISMLGMYQVIPEPKYLQAAEVLIRKVIECHDPAEGDFKGTMARPTTKNNWGTFVIGSPVLESLIMYAEMTGDAAARETIVRAAKRLARLNWLEEIGEWEYTHSMLEGHERAHNPKTNKMVVPAVLYAYLYSGDEELLQKSMTAFRHSEGISSKNGKDLGQSYCFGVRIPALLDRCIHLAEPETAST
ncbi:hypothetical protein [Marinicrinis lubricantis]|uniref:PcRGLX/YetA-like central beta-sandwich domain-containing protein n=1 Tax=Marinicrinis lubricantis TaxID=2086470 RepID=A0ABW1IVR1_9BACL